MKNSQITTDDAGASSRAAHGSANSWPGAVRHAMHQSEHEAWNASHYPGTRQMCAKCGEPTGRCEEDAMWNEGGEAVCEVCYSPNDKVSDGGPLTHESKQDANPPFAAPLG